MLRHWLDKFDSRDPQQRTKRTGAKLIVEMALRNHLALGTCFSEERDLLSQWRGYAQDGTGFSVSFKKHKLESLASQKVGKAELALRQISYENQDAERTGKIISQLYSAFGADADGFSESSDGIGFLPLTLSHEKIEQQRRAARELFTVKNGGFKEEREWRLLLFDYHHNIEGIEFRESRSVLSPYVPLEFEPKAIASVTLGPANPTPTLTIEQALAKYDIQAEVIKSTASYRS